MTLLGQNKPLLKGSLRLEIAFETKDLRRICEQTDYAIKKLGKDISAQLRHRLADIRAASTINDLLVGNLAPIKGSKAFHMRLNLADNCYMVFCANHTKNPRAIEGISIQSIAQISQAFPKPVRFPKHTSRKK